MSRQVDTPHYYAPYDSGDDTTVESDDESDGNQLPDSEDYRIRREEDPRYAIIAAAGPNFDTSALQMKYMQGAMGSEYDITTNITSYANYTYLNPPKTTQSNLFTLKSSNRDTKVWPTPFRFQLKTPRVYKNVTKFQLVNINIPYSVTSVGNIDVFTSSFYNYFSSIGYANSCISCCLNYATNCGTSLTSFGIIEQGRSEIGQLLTKIEVPPGSYNNAQLATELTLQSNSTPPFVFISYQDFQDEFRVTRDIGLLFNEPGDNFISGINKQRFGRHSKDTIMNQYYTQQHLDSFPVITEQIAFNAYYYPVLKELLNRRAGSKFINTNGTNLTEDTVVDIVLNKFQGLNSPLYYTLCSTNKSILDRFRQNLTFEHVNINKYTWSYDEINKRFQCSIDGLHTSIKNDIQNKLNMCTTQELRNRAMSQSVFNTLKTNNIINDTILHHLKSNMSTVLSNWFPGESNYQYLGGDYHSTFLRGSWNSYSVADLSADSTFNTYFNYTSTFGCQFGNYIGKEFTFTNFTDYHSTMSSYYNIIQSTINAISTLQDSIYERHHQYVLSRYKTILPQDSLSAKSYNLNQSISAQFVNNQVSYTPGVFSNNADTTCTDASGNTCNCVALQKIVDSAVTTYYSCLPVNSILNTVIYRTGIRQLNPECVNDSITSLFTFPSVNNNFNYLLQINNELSFNNLDVAMDENYNISNEPTGQVSLMAVKVLTAGLTPGAIAQTAIQNPIVFKNPLGKLDKLEISIFADDRALTPMWFYLPFPFQYALSEWDATFQIDEEIGYMDRDKDVWSTNPTIPIPTNPNSMPYLSLISKKDSTAEQDRM